MMMGDQPAAARGATAHASDDPTELLQRSNRDGSSINIVLRIILY